MSESKEWHEATEARQKYFDKNPCPVCGKILRARTPGGSLKSKATKTCSVKCGAKLRNMAKALANPPTEKRKPLEITPPDLSGPDGEYGKWGGYANKDWGF